MLREVTSVSHLGRCVITATVALLVIKTGACSSSRDVDWYYPELCVPHAPCPVSTGVGSGGGAGGAGGQPQPECMSASDCPPPSDKRCGTAVCTNGACGLAIPEGPIASQIRGDCQVWVCDQTGAVVTIEAPEDWYDDGRECTKDLCTAGSAINPPLPNGTPCPKTIAGVCYKGDCVECIDEPRIANSCSLGLTCDDIYCVSKECTQNNKKDGPETGTDCGGPCAPCPPTDTCAIGGDCLHGVCISGLCKLPTCFDDLKNDGETGIDCGAADCPACPDGEKCVTGKNCDSGVCWAGFCVAPTCTDGIKNGDELGLDCGGPCSPCSFG